MYTEENFSLKAAAFSASETYSTLLPLSVGMFSFDLEFWVIYEKKFLGFENLDFNFFLSRKLILLFPQNVYKTYSNHNRSFDFE